MYKRKIIIAKENSWREFLSEVCENTPFGVHFNIAKGNISNALKLASKRRMDGTLIKDIIETLNRPIE